MSRAGLVRRVVVVGASLAGWSAAQELRRLGFDGSLTVVGDEPYLPYDRTPLTKGVLTGRLSPDATPLPRDAANLDAEWVLGMAAGALNRSTQEVVLTDGRRLSYDRVLISTGMRARPWPRSDEARLRGVVTVRGRDDATALAARLAGRPRRVLVVGAGFIGSEVASSCRELGLDVTVVDRAEAPLQAALGQVFGVAAAKLQREHGVDLRLRTSVARIHDDGSGQVCAATLDDGSTVAVGLVVVAVGSVPATEWLSGSGLLLAPGRTVTCDSSLRALTVASGGGGPEPDDTCYAAGDVAAVPHPNYGDELLSVEHWGTAIDHGNTAAHNLLRPPAEHRPVSKLPRFWSNQFGVNLKSVGVVSVAEEMIVAQGSVRERRGVALYGRAGVTAAAVAINAPRELEPYAGLVAAGAPFPAVMEVADRGNPPQPVGVRFAAALTGTSHESETEAVGPVPRSEARPDPDPDPDPDPRREVFPDVPTAPIGSSSDSAVRRGLKT